MNFSNLLSRCISYQHMHLFRSNWLKPVLPLLAAFVLLAMAILFFAVTKTMNEKNKGERMGAGTETQYFSPLICI